MAIYALTIFLSADQKEGQVDHWAQLVLARRLARQSGLFRVDHSSKVAPGNLLTSSQLMGTLQGHIAV